MEDELEQNVEQEEQLLEGESEADLEEYVPNLTYSVKGEERSFDDRLKDVIKSKEDEEYFKQLYTKADGLDYYKQNLAEKDKILEDYRTRLEQSAKIFGDMVSYRDSKDMRKLMKSLNVDKDTLIEYAYDLLKEDELPEEQRTVIHKNREYEEKMEALQNQIKSYEDRLNAFDQEKANKSIQDEITELRGYISGSSELDTYLKSIGIDLTSEVLNHGIQYHAINGKDLSVQDAFTAVANKFSKLLPTKEEQIETIIKKRPATIPVIKGSTQSAPDERITMSKLRELRGNLYTSTR